MPKILEFDNAVYSLDAVLATAYWCADTAIVEVNQKENLISAKLSPRTGKMLDPSFIETFQTMVVHNQIRHRLEEKFAPLEKIIIEKAFAPVSSKE